MTDMIGEEQAGPTRDKEQMAKLGDRLRGMFDQYEKDRKPLELQWLKNLRQYNGVYDPEIVIPDDQSSAYPKVTRTKVVGTIARMMEMLFPQTEKNFSVTNSPLADLEAGDLQTVLDTLMAENPNGDGTLTDQQIEKAIEVFAREKCERLELEIVDQLEELNYIDIARSVVRSGVIYGPGTVFGPLVQQVNGRTWAKDGLSGRYKAVEVKKNKPLYEFVPCWEWYPDLSGRSLDQNQQDGSFRRHVMARVGLMELSDRPDFDSEAIRNWLRDNTLGNYKERHWEADLRQGQKSDRSEVTNLDGRKIELIEFWGLISGKELRACGIEVSEKELPLEHECNVWILDKTVIKSVITPYDSKIRPYHTFIFEDDEINLLGCGLPQVVRDSQLAICEATRCLLDNASVVAGPILEVDTDRIKPGLGYDIYARKVFLKEDELGIGDKSPAVREVNVQSHIPDLIGIVDLFMQFADSETALPPSALGDVSKQGKEPLRTTGNLSMLLGAAALPIRDVVRNFDKFTISFIGSLVEWNKQFNPNPSLKGDPTVIARGSTSLVAKEVRGNNLNQFMLTLSEEDKLHIKTRETLIERAKAFDLPMSIMEDEEVVARKLKERADMASAAAKQQQAFSQAEIRGMVAQAFKDLMLGLKAQAGANADTFTAIVEGITNVASAGGEGGKGERGGTSSNSAPASARAGVAGAS